MNECCICCPVLNAGKYMDKVLNNMIKLGSTFSAYKIILFYEHSQDNTIDIILRHMKINKNITLLVNKTYKQKREHTHNLAYARNKLLEHVRNQYNNMEYMIMMDATDMTSSPVKADVLIRYLKRSDWDALTFQWRGEHQDVWSVSMKHLGMSVWHLSQPHAFQVYKRDLKQALDNCGVGQLVEVFSAFNGVCLYRTKLFTDSLYDGNPRMDLIPQFISNTTIREVGPTTPYFWKKAGEEEQDSEHRAFHHYAKFVNNAKIRISSESIFS